ncbi:hypothetical protein BDQ94DRAFT_164229 [Aspergillus welwitschiae]|uniref:Uncharacterized protein n=1 Tax=Aspergillus welwitschiae TaxID=1341132 RepID=A0A3F3PIG3_9EURO|nr:hypothetical protein BDQ94DRAFT_164229 [Aspergillus welwitschiae]RDH26730.1 hypothetical protein BDQ94DRAFT_164229 [Aspergillus welwitschiae]
MDEQRPLPPLEDYYTQVSRDALRTDERLGGVATAAEGFASVAAPVRQQPEDTSATEPVENHPNFDLIDGNSAGWTEHVRSAFVGKSSGSTCVPRSDRQSVNHRTMMSTEPRTEKSPVSRGYRWSVFDMGRASDVAVPRNSAAERGSPTTCAAYDGNSTLPYQIGDNAGWGPPSGAIALANSYMLADNSTRDPTADPWYLTQWAMEPCSSEALPASFWTDGFSHPSIPAPQAAGWSFGGEAEQPQVYHPSPSFDPPEPIPSSDALGIPSILETAPPNFPRFPRLQHVEDGSLALPAESPMLLPPWDPLAPVSAALPMTNFHRRSLHQEPSAPVHVRNFDSFDNVGVQ